MQVSATAETLPATPGALAPADHAADHFVTLRTGSLADFAREFAELESLPGHTPYQSRRFLAAFEQALPPSSLRIVMAGDREGRANVLFPLVVERHALAVARFAGGSHANYHMALWRPEATMTLTRQLMQRLLQRVGRAIQADSFGFQNQPHDWQGFANPLALLPHQPSPSFAYKLGLQADGTALLASRLSHDARSKLRRKEKRLAGMGTLTYLKASTDAEANLLLDAFLRKRAQRFREQGLADPFVEPGISAFLRAGITGPVPAIEMHGLLAGDRVVATFGAVTSSDRFCGLFTAFDTDQEVAKCSPGDLLIAHLVRQACARGLSTFDLGVGEAGYKANYCDMAEPLFDSHIAITPLGSISAGAFALRGKIKRRIKQDPALMGLIARLRRLRASP